MDYGSSSPVRKVKCEKCNKAIDISRFDLHNLQCKVKEERPKEVKTKAVQPPKPKKPESTKSQSNDIDERIPCINCDYQMKLTELDSHPKVCVNRQINCQHCNIKYPRNLMTNHAEVCPSRPVRAQSIDLFNRPFVRVREEDRAEDTRSRAVNSRDPIFNHEMYHEPSRRFFTAIDAIRREESRTGVTSYLQDIRQYRYMVQESANRALSKPQTGLPPQSIRLIAQKKYERTAEEEECCSICCIQFKKGERLKDLKCLHNFHSKCISEWLKINRACPLCKTDLSVNVPNVQREEKVEQKDRKREELENEFLRMIRNEAGFYQDSDDSDMSFD